MAFLGFKRANLRQFLFRSTFLLGLKTLSYGLYFIEHP